MNRVNNKKGFTLVELLAVIVILGIIMVIAIPSVLETMQVAKVKSLEEYAEKVKSVGEQKYLVKKEFEGIKSPGVADIYVYLYDVKNDLDLTNTGNYKGIFLMFKFSSSFFEKAHVSNTAAKEIKPNTPYFGVILEDDENILIYLGQNVDSLEQSTIISIDEMNEMISSQIDGQEESSIPESMIDLYKNMFTGKEGFANFFKGLLAYMKEELSSMGMTIEEYESTLPDDKAVRFMLVDGDTNDVILSTKLIRADFACDCEEGPGKANSGKYK